MTINLDACFQSFPKIPAVRNHDGYWEKQWKLAKEGRRSLRSKLRLGQSIGRETRSDLYFEGLDGHPLHGILSLPGKFGKWPLIVTIHDYMETTPIFFPELMHAGFAQFSLLLRGHEKAFKTAESEEEEEGPARTAGYFRQNLESRDKYYMKSVYNDVFVALQVLNRNNNIDRNKIGIYGKGIGAAAAAYSAWLDKRISALFMESPAFTCLEISQNISREFYSREILDGINAKNRAKVKKELSWFDTLLIAEELTVPVCVVSCYKDTITPPEAVFGFFNHLTCEKDIQIFPNEDHYPAPGLLGPVAENFFKEQLK